ncbi:MAG: putative extracellular nuclease [Oleispira sp.]|jgi:predicted extracellular nuclease
MSNDLLKCINTGYRAVLSCIIIIGISVSLGISNSVLASSNGVLGACGDFKDKNFYSISDIQGAGFTSPLIGRSIITEGVVTLVLQGRHQYRGFWLQQQDSSNTSNKTSSSVSLSSSVSKSKGIFVYHQGTPVTSGQRVRLSARVEEYKGLTEVKKIKTLKICERGLELPKAEVIILPVSSLLQLEAKEGMRIILPQELVVSDLHGAGYGLGNYGQFAVSSQLHSQPTELWTAAQLRKSKAGSLLKQELDYLLIDDGSARAFPKFIPFPTIEGFSAENPIRVSDRVRHVSGILHAYDDHYIVIPDNTAAISIQTAYPRTNTPRIAKNSNVIIASMNLGNYFNGDGKNNKKNNAGFPTARGAKSMAGFTLQTEKIVSALVAMDADIIALMEVENDGYDKDSAINSLTQALNEKIKETHQSHVYAHSTSTSTSTSTSILQYRYVKPASKQLTQGKLGRDVIAVGFLYRPERVSLSGATRVLDSRRSKNALFNDRRNRPSLIQTFKFNQQSFVVAVNHFKSKGRPCNEVEVDTLQGNCNVTRYYAALALAAFLKPAEDASLPILILGDLNAYSQEEPLLALYEAGFLNLKYMTDLLPKESLSFPYSFSYNFRGLLGNLDHALANLAFLPFIKSVDSWHINSLEDVLLDYSTEENGHKPPAVDTYGSPDRVRSSDHDPVILGLQFPEPSLLN